MGPGLFGTVSDHPGPDAAHREENLDVFDFHLTEDEHRRITTLAS